MGFRRPGLYRVQQTQFRYRVQQTQFRYRVQQTQFRYYPKKLTWHRLDAMVDQEQSKHTKPIKSFIFFSFSSFIIINEKLQNILNLLHHFFFFFHLYYHWKLANCCLNRMLLLGQQESWLQMLIWHFYKIFRSMGWDLFLLCRLKTK